MEAKAVLIGIDPVVLDVDDPVAAVVTADTDTTEEVEGESVVFYFVEEDDKFLIDNIQQLDVEGEEDS